MVESRQTLIQTKKEGTVALKVVLAFDPGISYMGWAVLRCDTDNKDITHIASGTIVGTIEYSKEEKDLRRAFKRSFVTLIAYEKAIEELIKLYTPDIVVSEGAFYHKFLNTFASLTLIIHVIRRISCCLIKRDIGIISPAESKNVLTKKSCATKEDMTDALLSLDNFNHLSRDTTTEHEVDACAHALAYIKKELFGEEI
jgi:Holliday junction resolvasome RuvABC endonuclease subunit